MHCVELENDSRAVNIALRSSAHIYSRRNQTRKEQITMAQAERKNWRELCKSALGAKDPDELLKILQELKQALKSEEQVRRDFREAMRTISPR